TARYSSGNGAYSDSTGTLTLTVQSQVVMGATTTTLASSADTTPSGQPFTLTATVAPVDPNAGVAEGSVSFIDGNTDLGDMPLDSRGMATLPLSTLGVGSHSIVAHYTPSGPFSSSDSDYLTETIVSSTTTTLTSSVPVLQVGQVLALMVGVTS